MNQLKSKQPHNTLYRAVTVPVIDKMVRELTNYTAHSTVTYPTTRRVAVYFQDNNIIFPINVPLNLITFIVCYFILNCFLIYLL